MSDVGQAFEGTGDEGARNAAAELQERRRSAGTGNAAVDAYQRGELQHAWGIAEDAPEQLASTNKNAPGDDPKKSARGLAEARRARDRADRHTANTLGLTPVADADETDASTSAQEREPQQLEQPQQAPAQEHPEIAAARQRAAQAEEHAALVVAEHRSIRSTPPPMPSFPTSARLRMCASCSRSTRRASHGCSRPTRSTMRR
jgi:hypothetical protein